MNKRIFAIGDIHGCFEQLEALFNKIKPRKSDLFIFLGDYIDKGPDSKKVLDFIINLNEKGYKIITLMGNHESLLINAYNDNCDLSKWIQNGGHKTLNSFKLNLINNLESKYWNFLNNLDYYFEMGQYLFVHAGFNDEIENPFLDTYSMLWKSKEIYSSPILKDKVVIHGHSPISTDITNKQIREGSKVIDIDNGCVYSSDHLGKLIALEVNTKTIFFVE